MRQVVARLRRWIMALVVIVTVLEVAAVAFLYHQAA